MTLVYSLRYNYKESQLILNLYCGMLYISKKGYQNLKNNFGAFSFVSKNKFSLSEKTLIQSGEYIQGYDFKKLDQLFCSTWNGWQSFRGKIR